MYVLFCLQHARTNACMALLGAERAAQLERRLFEAQQLLIDTQRALQLTRFVNTCDSEAMGRVEWRAMGMGRKEGLRERVRARVQAQDERWRQLHASVRWIDGLRRGALCAMSSGTSALGWAPQCRQLITDLSFSLTRSPLVTCVLFSLSPRGSHFSQATREAAVSPASLTLPSSQTPLIMTPADVGEGKGDDVQSSHVKAAAEPGSGAGVLRLKREGEERMAAVRIRDDGLHRALL